MTGPTCSPQLVESMLHSFEVLAAACQAELDETASPTLLATLHDPALRLARANCLLYLETLLEGELLIAKLSRNTRRRSETARIHRRAETLRVASMHELRAEQASRHDRAPFDRPKVCAWLMKLILAEDYSQEFDLAMAAAGHTPQRRRLPTHDWWSWAVANGWIEAATNPVTDRLLELDARAFTETVRRSLTGQVEGLDAAPVVERWWRALSSVEVQVRSEIQELLGEITARSTRARLARMRERYTEWATLRVERSVAQHAYNELRDAIAAAVRSDADTVAGCHAAASAALAEANPVLWDRVQTVVALYLERSGRDDSGLTVDAQLADELIVAVAPEQRAGNPAPPTQSDCRVTVDAPGTPLEVAVDASGYGTTGGYGWMAADGCTGSGRCNHGISATESEVIAICEAALAPELAGRELYILSDCVSAVDAVAAALRDGVVGGFPQSPAARDHLYRAIDRAAPFTVQWIASRNGNRLHDAAHRLARAGRWSDRPTRCDGRHRVGTATLHRIDMSGRGR